MVISFSKRDKNSYDSRLKDCDRKIGKKMLVSYLKKGFFGEKLKEYQKLL